MSYDIAVWYSSVPVNAAAALAHYQKLGDGNLDGGESSPSVRKFYSELNKLYKSLDADDGDESPWSVDPDISKHHVAMCITYSSVNEVVPMIAALAAKHGLVFYDPQSNSVINPDKEANTEAAFLAIKQASKQRRENAKKFEKDILVSIGEGLIAAGFKKRSRTHLTFELEKGIRGVLVLGSTMSSSSDYAEVRIQPYIGVCHEEFNQVFMKVWGAQYDVYERTTGCPFGYVSREKNWREWIFFTPGNYDSEFLSYFQQLKAFGYDGDLNTGIDDLVQSIKEYGVAYFRGRTTLESICNAILSDSLSVGYMQDAKKVVALTLLGKPNEAAKLLTKQLKKIEKSLPMAESYRTFADRYYAQRSSMASMA